MKILLGLTIFIFSVNQIQAGSVDSINYAPFGKIALYQPDGIPNSVTLFVSGDGGWELGVKNMAQKVCNMGGLVLGIDAKVYKKSLKHQSSGCAYPAADFENLSLMIQKKYKFSEYLKPILMGYSYGASLVYGVLAQAPANTFKGAIALGFCPDIDLPRPLCKGTALTFHALKGKQNMYYLEKTMGLTAPLIVLNGMKDLNCEYMATQAFLKGLPMAELITLPKVGHGFAVDANWVPELTRAYDKIKRAPSFSKMKSDENSLLKKQNLAPLDTDLPLTLLPSAKNSELPMVFFISGDGGWTSFDHAFSAFMANQGMPVVGLDAQRYFWKEKSPEQSAKDMGKAIGHYLQQWDKKNFILVGFSFGASVAPFIASRLSAELRGKLHSVVLFSPDDRADFEIHIMDMLSLGKNRGTYLVLPEILKIKSLAPLCVFGSDEENGFLKKLIGAGIATSTISGGHHYNNNYSSLTDIVVKQAKRGG